MWISNDSGYADEDSDHSGGIGGCGGRVPIATTVQIKLTGVGFVLPDVSVALTWNAWLVPAARLLRVSELVQAENCESSRLHSIAAIPPISSTNSNVNVIDVENVDERLLQEHNFHQ